MFQKLIKFVKNKFSKEVLSESVLLYIPKLNYFPVLIRFDYKKEQFRLEYEHTNEFDDQTIHYETQLYIESMK